MLSDSESVVIRQFGLLNETIDPDSRYHGVPYPGIFLLDAEGVIRAKYAEENYRDRPLLDDILSDIRELPGLPAGLGPQ